MAHCTHLVLGYPRGLVEVEVISADLIQKVQRVYGKRLQNEWVDCKTLAVGRASSSMAASAPWPCLDFPYAANELGWEAGWEAVESNGATSGEIGYAPYALCP